MNPNTPDTPPLPAPSRPRPSPLAIACILLGAALGVYLIYPWADRVAMPQPAPVAQPPADPPSTAPRSPLVPRVDVRPLDPSQVTPPPEPSSRTQRSLFALLCALGAVPGAVVGIGLYALITLPLRRRSKSAHPRKQP